MFPELLSLSAISLLSDKFDPQREGVAIEIGVGTDNFYSIEYSKAGFSVIAVDPIPCLDFLKLAEENNIAFEEACIYDTEGEIFIYSNEHTDLSSVNENWWGVDKTNVKKVKAIRLQTLLNKYNVKKITFLKVDTEGSEYEILQQLQDLEESYLPSIVEFEYGGGDIKETGKGGWEDEFFKKVISSLLLFKKFNYKYGIIIDSIDPVIYFFKFEDTSNPAILFKPHFEYGNILLFKNDVDIKDVLTKEMYKSQSLKLVELLLGSRKENAVLQLKLYKMKYWTRITNKLKRIFAKL